MWNSDIVVVFLFVMMFYLGKEDYVDVRGMFDNNGVIVLVIDYNFGSSVINNL